MLIENVITICILFVQYLNRLVVKGNSAVVCIPELDFEIPSNTQKGNITTVESVLSQAISDLEKDQPLRKVKFLIGLHINMHNFMSL